MLRVRFFDLFKNVKNPLDVSHILFVTLSNIGDAVLTTPTLEALHQQFPNAVIDIVCDKRSAIIFQHYPYLGQLIFKEKQAGWKGLLALARKLRQKKYDIAVDLRTDGLLYFVSARIKAFKLSNRKTINMHSAEKHYAVLKKIVSAPIPPAKIWLADTETSKADEALKTYSQQRVLAIGLGANFTGKIWPASSFAILANALKAFFDVVLIFGDKHDALLSEQFKSHCQLPVVDYCGQLNLLETAAYLRKAHLYIGNDSGLGHIASALDLPTFTVFGVGQPARYVPWSKKAMWYQDPQFEIKNVDPLKIAEILTPVLKRSLASNP
jgi:heptosyltransferase III